MLDNHPSISVVMPSFNQAPFLEGAIESVLAQSLPALELIIMDGGSSDGSVDIIRKYEENTTFWRSRPDEGQSSAINEGINWATGDIVCWLNSDDRFTDNALHTVCRFFRERPELDIICGAASAVSPDGKELYVKNVPDLQLDRMLEWRTYLPQPSCFFRRDAFLFVGGVDESLHFQMDYDLWLKFAKAEMSFLSVPDVLSNYTVHPSAKTSDPANSLAAYREYVKVICRHADLPRVFRELKKNMPNVLKDWGTINSSIRIWLIALNSLLRRYSGTKIR